MAFWKKFYKSKYTGAEIDAAVAKAGDATKVTANPTLAGTEAALTGLQVGDTKYKAGGVLPVIQFTQIELASIFTDIMTLIIGATDKLTNQQFVITGDTVASLIEKIHAVTKSPNRCGYLQIEGFDGSMFVCVGDDDAFQSVPVRVRGSTPTTYSTQLWLLINWDGLTAVYINAFVQKINIAT